jgi:hypothetical protein
MVEICGADSEKNCISEQKGAGATIARYLPKGAVSVSFYNFTENAVVANITVVFKYCRRRYY